MRSATTYIGLFMLLAIQVPSHSVCLSWRCTLPIVSIRLASIGSKSRNTYSSPGSGLSPPALQQECYYRQHLLLCAYSKSICHSTSHIHCQQCDTELKLAIPLPVSLTPICRVVWSRIVAESEIMLGWAHVVRCKWAIVMYIPKGLRDGLLWIMHTHVSLP